MSEHADDDLPEGPPGPRGDDEPTDADPGTTDALPRQDIMPSPSAPGNREAVAASAVMPTLEGYRILELISDRGGQGTVWKAIQLGTNRTVALKFLRAGVFSSAQYRARFEREVELTASLEHPHIARLYDSALHRGVYYYAMELIDGVTLDRYSLVGAGQRGILRLMRTVCLAVQHAHQRGIIHRDLKPANIMVGRDGEPRVMDFGLGKALRHDAPAIDVSQPGVILGTYPYMSPEQAAGEFNELDTRTDVYSLGVILYELLTGRLPRDASGPTWKVLRRVIEDEARPPREVSRDIDRELEALLLKALAHDRELRYASAGELAADLDNYLTGEPLKARRPTTAYFLRKRLYKHRLPVAGAALALLAIVAGVAYHIASITAEIARTRLAMLKAQGQYALAERNAGIALDTVGGLVFEVQDKLRDTPASARLRGELLAIAQDGMRRIADEANSAPLLVARSKAAAMLQLGDLALSEGRMDEARTDYAQALRDFEWLANGGRDGTSDATRRARRDLSIAHTRMGKLLLKAGDGPGAEDHFRRAVGLLESLERQAPIDPTLCHDRWALLISLGDVEVRAGRDAEAQGHYLKALSIIDALAASRSKDLRVRRDLAMSCRRLGDLELRRGRGAEALRYYHRAAEIDRGAAVDPHDPAAERNLAFDLTKLAQACSLAGQLDKAGRQACEALAIYRERVAAGESDVPLRAGLATALYTLGELSRAAGDGEAAARHYREAVEALRAGPGGEALGSMPECAELLGRIEARLALVSSRPASAPSGAAKRVGP